MSVSVAVFADLSLNSGDRPRGTPTSGDLNARGQ